MENIIPVLLIVGGLIYKIYQNYQEEMEKARKRQQKIKPATSSSSNPVPAPPTHNQKLGRPKPQKIVIAPKDQPKTEPIQHIKVEETKKELPAEVIRMREQRQREQIKRLEIEETERVASNEKQQIDFDLRQAVIQSAILERPYK